MLQVVFSPFVNRVLESLPFPDRMRLVEQISSVNPKDADAIERGELSLFEREGRGYYRLRIGDFRCYIEIESDSVLNALYLIHKNTLTDFAIRTAMPVSKNQIEKEHNQLIMDLEAACQHEDARHESSS